MKKIRLLLTSIAMSLAMNLAVFAADINSIDFTITCDGETFTQETTHVTTSTAHAIIRKVEVNEEAKEVTITAAVDDGKYRYALSKASQVTINSDKLRYQHARKTNNSSILIATLTWAEQTPEDNNIWNNVEGTWKQDENGWWYENKNGAYPKNTWLYDFDGKWYYFNSTGYMVTNQVIDGGYQVDENGVCTNPQKLVELIAPIDTQENVIEDTLPFLYNGELVETPCKIYFKDYRKGRYTTVKYNSAYIQEWNGKSTNLIIDYIVEKTGGYNSTYFGCDVYVNGIKRSSLGGEGGNAKIYFNQNVTSVSIPTETFVPGDLIEIHINK